jgi:hypothetical protein
MAMGLAKSRVPQMVSTFAKAMFELNRKMIMRPDFIYPPPVTNRESNDWTLAFTVPM